MMADSKFWRVLAVVAVAGVFYLGHGLHDPSASLLPELETELHAGDVATAINNGNGLGLMRIITSSDNGRTIHVWSTTTTSGSAVKFLGSFPAVKGK
jgi:hypothetical protein